ncbi:Hsp33 family molecular chaperone HslO [Macrococcus armenti]|uniref:Hsp33 family molecular chaperone HslO n=1 Tax=Macrococcus armenti TaxID=2875764 RepID=UPI001CCC3E78|nr:Hsp33 family molecular chaperone HslO [Macrococcus armenti]UBH08539.1 Hsp33 family molecular chaperone HslO [Macrococcus armenti]UBH10824.1 Hsp33 family molecular chaperone HslO [Macrococcus armenti]UBH15305.1 Hsp33 family molecular chaperone HslO [Macrococcus armenti]UBH17663.1 Hsp33 family molecular chaperone HslO [Macrococcus armenti]UBH19930.1 Hsp33 family molecular chaperone HslO [Macrococcus armenti]
MKQDYLVRALAFNDEVRAFSVRTTNTVETARQKHDTWRVGTAALGRTITAGAMMGAMLKNEERLTITINGGGPLGQIVVDANGKGEVRGYVENPYVEVESIRPGKMNVGAAVGTNGFLRVVKDIGMKDYFTGSTELHNGEIAEDFTYYFATSEQVPSAVGLGVLCTPEETTDAAGGFIIQLMPGASEETISLLEERIANLMPISTLIDRGLSPEQVLEEVLGEDNIRILDQMPVEFKCNCGREKFLNAIKGLGEAEIKSMIEEDHGAEVECHFCREKYQFSEADLEALL